MMVPPRTDKSGHIHTRQLVTLPYLNAQRENQIAYYQGYYQYVLLPSCTCKLQLLIKCRTRAQVDDISEVQRLQLEIVNLVTEHRVEVDVLHHRAQGSKMAGSFINRLNRRWKPLELLVSSYNLSISKPIFEGRLSPLSPQVLKDDAIADHDGEI